MLLKKEIIDDNKKLKEENKKLKEEIEQLQLELDSEKSNSAKAYKRILKAYKRILKAIEYLKSYNTDFKHSRFNEAPISIRELGDLLDILEGSDKE